jgi:hypothetical protein
MENSLTNTLNTWLSLFDKLLLCSVAVGFWFLHENFQTSRPKPAVAFLLCLSLLKTPPKAEH